MKKIINVYVRCSFTEDGMEAGDNFKKDIETLKDYLEKSMKGVKVLEFGGLEERVSEVDVYDFCFKNCMKKADLIIAECSYLSFETKKMIATAVVKPQMHVLAIARDNSKVTSLVVGAEYEKNPNYSFKTYHYFHELLGLVIEKINQIRVFN